MALTGRVVASIYGINGSGTTSAGLSGVVNSFPSALTTFKAAPAGTTMNTVTINSIITLLPSGLKVNTIEYYTDSTTTQLATNGS